LPWSLPPRSPRQPSPLRKASRTLGLLPPRCRRCGGCVETRQRKTVGTPKRRRIPLTVTGTYATTTTKPGRTSMSCLAESGQSPPRSTHPLPPGTRRQQHCPYLHFNRSPDPLIHTPSLACRPLLPPPGHSSEGYFGHLALHTVDVPLELFQRWAYVVTPRCLRVDKTCNVVGEGESASGQS